MMRGRGSLGKTSSRRPHVAEAALQEGADLFSVARRGVKLWVSALPTAPYSERCAEVERGSFGRCAGPVW